MVVAGLNWRQVNILRAYRMYRQRIGSRFTQGYQNDVLAANPELTAKLMRYFELRFDPRSRATRTPRRRCARRSSPTSTRSPRSTTTASCATSSG